MGRIHFRPVEFWGCCNIAAISGSSSTNTIGGILGYGMGTVGSTKNITEVYQSYNSGAISGYKNIGGLIGAITGTLTVNNCYNSGTASSSNSENCAGLFKLAEAAHIIYEQYNVGAEYVHICNEREEKFEEIEEFNKKYLDNFNFINAA